MPIEPKKPDRIGLFGTNIFFIRIGCAMCKKRFFSADLRQGLDPPKQDNYFQNRRQKTKYLRFLIQRLKNCEQRIIHQ